MCQGVLAAPGVECVEAEYTRVDDVEESEVVTADRQEREVCRKGSTIYDKTFRIRLEISLAE